MSFEKQLAYLEKLHAEFPSDSEPEDKPDDDDASLEGDYEEVQDHDTDMEEDIEERILESPKTATKIDLFSFIHNFKIKRRLDLSKITSYDAYDLLSDIPLKGSDVSDYDENEDEDIDLTLELYLLY
uniref:Uncharacterized protein LOC114342275 n=1 Tax=Diabrotica virgifera virgifera TaxID=50390 RepID=A0A6P7GS39_DIAVI